MNEIVLTEEQRIQAFSDLKELSEFVSDFTLLEFFKRYENEINPIQILDYDLEGEDGHPFVDVCFKSITAGVYEKENRLNVCYDCVVVYTDGDFVGEFNFTDDGQITDKIRIID